jgi:hypothetical protein
MVFRKITAVYYKNNEKRINKLCQKREFWNVKSRLVRNVHEMPGRTSGVSSPHQHKEKLSYQYISANSFRGAAKHCGDLSPLDFYLWGHLRTLV